MRRDYSGEVNYLAKRVGENKEKLGKYRVQFYNTFGVPLSNYFDLITGLDIVRLDMQVIKPPDGTSTEDFVREKYGEEAVAMLVDMF